MKIEFVPYEQALALKELGFNEPCFGNYNNLTGTTRFFFGKTNEGCIVWNKVPGTNDIVTSNETILAPTFSQAFRFFREKYNLKVSFPYWNGFNGMIPDRMQYKYECIIVPENDKSITVRENGRVYFDTYEEAELACLDKLIEIVKTK
jgi:hypothetical protein